jgi:hypothetical protein
MPAMTLIRVPAAAYAALRCHAARFSTPGARHRDGSYTLAAAPEVLEHLGSLALGNETLGTTIVRVLQSSQGAQPILDLLSSSAARPPSARDAAA